MNPEMRLKRLEDFTPRIAKKALKRYISSADKKHIRISTKQLNLIRNGIHDSNMVKYVVSIGDALYQIVAIKSSCTVFEKPVSVNVRYFPLSETRRCCKECLIDISDDLCLLAYKYLKECIKPQQWEYEYLTLEKLNLIKNGICDGNMTKYVVSAGYTLYQVAIIDTYGIKPKLMVYSSVI